MAQVARLSPNPSPGASSVQEQLEGSRCRVTEQRILCDRENWQTRRAADLRMPGEAYLGTHSYLGRPAREICQAHRQCRIPSRARLSAKSSDSQRLWSARVSFDVLNVGAGNAFPSASGGDTAHGAYLESSSLAQPIYGINENADRPAGLSIILSTGDLCGYERRGRRLFQRCL